MAKIPDFTALGGSPTPQAVSNVIPFTGHEMDQAEATHQLGQVLTGSGVEFSRIYKQEKERQDALAAEDAYNKLQNKKLDLTMGDNGFVKLEGNDVVNKPWMQDYTKKFSDSTTEIGGTLGNDRQRELFKARADVAQIQYKQDMLRHHVSASDAYAKQVFGSTIDVETKNASQRWQDPSAIDVSKTRVESAINTEAERQGWSKEMIDSARMKALSGLNVGVVQQAADNNNLDYAKGYYYTNKKDIDPKLYGKIESLLQEGDIKYQSQNASDEILSKNFSEQEAVKVAEKKYSGEMRDAVVKRIQDKFSFDNQATQLAQKKAGDSAWGIYGQSRRFDDIPISTLQSMDGKERENLRAYAEKQASGEETKTDLAVYYKLRQVAATDPDTFARMDLRSHIGTDLGPAEFKELTKLQTDDKGLQMARSKEQLYKQSIVDLGLDPKDEFKDNNDGKKIRDYYKRLDTEIESFKAVHDRNPNAKEMSEISNNLGLTVIKERRFWFNKETPAVQTKIEGIPDTMIDELSAAVKKAGQPVTEDNIKKLYNYMSRK